MSLAEMFSLGGKYETPPNRLLLSVDEARRSLGIGRTTLYAEMDAGRIRTIKVGARRMIPVSALNDFIEQRLLESAGE
jgi:excisionase family DNA binding protein